MLWHLLQSDTGCSPRNLNKIPCIHCLETEHSQRPKSRAQLQFAGDYGRAQRFSNSKQGGGLVRSEQKKGQEQRGGRLGYKLELSFYPEIIGHSKHMRNRTAASISIQIRRSFRFQRYSNNYKTGEYILIKETLSNISGDKDLVRLETQLLSALTMS